MNKRNIGGTHTEGGQSANLRLARDIVAFGVVVDGT